MPLASMGMSGISKSSVSKLCKDIDERVNAFLKRPLAGGWPYLWLDATYLKVREGGRIVSVAVIVAVAVTIEGRREIVGLHIGPSEAEVFWTDFLRDLVKRGLAGVRLVISDAHEGLKAAIRRVLGATWQRCRVHWTRNALAYVPRTQQTMVAAGLRQAFQQPDQATARASLHHLGDQLHNRWPKLKGFIDESVEDVLAYLSFPVQHRAKLHSTNPLERLNKELKRRADVVGSRASLSTPQRGEHDRSHDVAAIGFEWSAIVVRGRLRPRYGQGCGEVPLNLRWQPDLRETDSGGADAPAQEEPLRADRAGVVRDHAAQHPVPDRSLRVSGPQPAVGAASGPQPSRSRRGSPHQAKSGR